MNSIDITTTSCIRPEIIRQTYNSFSEKIINLDLFKCRLIINIDPIPEENTYLIKEMKKTCYDYFENVVFNTPDKPNFTKALNWCWQQATTEIILNLEDDWILKDEVDFFKVKNIFNEEKNIYQLSLSETNEEGKISLAPSFLSKRFYKQIAGNLDTNINPEIQLRGKKFNIEMPSQQENILNNKKVFFYDKKSLIKDIGRDWIKSTRYKKPLIKSEFNSWVKD